MRAYALPSMSLRFVPVWRRNLLVWRKLAVPSILGNLADPLIYVLGLGYGLGSMLPQVGGVPYIAFLAAGMVCSSTMNSATFEAMYSAFSRMHVQRTWDAIMMAPLDLDDVGARRARLGGEQERALGRGDPGGGVAARPQPLASLAVGAGAGASTTGEM